MVSSPAGIGHDKSMGVPANHSPEIDAEVAARLRLAIGRLARRIRLDTEYGLPPLQHAALATIEAHGPLRLGELAQREGVTAPTMSRVLASLEERGLVDRRPDPDDARSVLLSLTGSGAGVLGAVRSAHTATLAARLRRLSGDQVESLRSALPILELLIEDDPDRTRKP
ncbi:MarR family winged helix-turn-helix transcriptional regulator [Fodinicola acaciae]|uniref:MarR family winged helix-turn-helix transcriptional regulator n=1 Tax=Fodinicola acaciae TaxID=2681555 RepID=UPI001C9E8887|nr:MarR family transcriptional regulator [Fodinicola acaciae]